MKYYIFILLCLNFLNISCVNKNFISHNFIKPSLNPLATNLASDIGANFFNDEETYERLLAAKNMGIKWIRLTPSKWKSKLYPDHKGSFLLGKTNTYQGLIEEDIKTLIQVLDWAHSLDIKVILTFLSVPGRIFTQHNNSKIDNRLWESMEYQEQAINFFSDISLYVSHHPALLAINPINEPSPEKANYRFFDWFKDDYSAWEEKIANTPQDLNQFYINVVKNIRKFNKNIPIMLDSGFHAHPWAFKILKPVNDKNVWYSFHWYEPFLYSQKQINYTYPGHVPTGENIKNQLMIYWDKNTLERFLQPVIEWQKKYNIKSSHIIVGEFGVNRLMQGAKDYLFDCRNLFLKHNFMHAFYQFREPHFPRMDYELGTENNIGQYWLALENNVSPNYERLRKSELINALGISPIKLKKPLRGFSTWNTFGPNINENLIDEIMHAMKTKGLLNKKFDTIIVDGGWRQEKLSTNGALLSDTKKFPDMSSLIKRVHEQGFKFGIHIPIGTKDCGNKTAGTFGFEKVNAKQLIDWQVDLAKLDQCILNNSEDWEHKVLETTHELWHQLLDPKIQTIASASKFWPWYPKFFNYGRTSIDLKPKIFGGAQFDSHFIGGFITVVQAAKQNSALRSKTNHLYSNDPDMLVIENGMSPVEDKSHFAMWAIMGAPLILGNDPRIMSSDTLKLITNEDLLFIQEDPTEQGKLLIDDKEFIVFKKHLTGGQIAILVVSLKKNGLLKKTFSYQELGIAPPFSIKSAFNPNFKSFSKKELNFTLSSHDCELLIVK